MLREQFEEMIQIAHPHFRDLHRVRRHRQHLYADGNDDARQANATDGGREKVAIVVRRDLLDRAVRHQ